MSKITVYQAKKIRTMDHSCPEATHVAVMDGRVLAVGDATCADQWGKVEHDARFANMVLTPGFVEGHAHMMAGAMWRYAYAGYHDRIDPDGKLWKGMTTIEEVIQGLSDFAAKLPEGEPLIAWGFDPIFLQTERLSRNHLDQISADRPISVVFSNFHLMCVNSKSLELAQYSRLSNGEGIVKDAKGEPTGELQEMAAMMPVMRRLGIDLRSLAHTEPAIRAYGQVANRAGVTTATDLFATFEGNDVAELTRITSEDSYPVRIVPALGAIGAKPAEIAQFALKLRAQSTDKLRMGAVKLMTDGSIQGWTARVKWPGYVGRQPNGIWNTPPELIHELVMEMHKAGVQMHIHTNGDEASEVSINAIEAAQRAHPWPSARHVLQHCQMMATDQFERCAELGICTNIFANHIWYFGDQHAALTIGEDRARRMDACRSARDAGVHFTIHSDAPVTPMAPLFTMWCAVNRQTMSGRILGAEQAITPSEALYAITMGAAYTLKLDAEIGSIAAGKRADFAVLSDDPLAVAPEAIKDIAVHGTVLGGIMHLL